MPAKRLIQPTQNRALHALLTKAGITEKAEKEALVKRYSATNATSSKELLETEAATLITFLEGAARLNQVSAAEDEKVKNQRNKLLSLAHEMRWTIDGQPTKVDVDRLMKWVASQGVKREKLNDLTSSDLNKLVTQMQILNTKRLLGR